MPALPSSKFATRALVAPAALAMVGLALTACGSKASDTASGDGGTAAESCVDTSGDTIKVGSLNSLSGTMAISEVTVRDSIALAIEEINAAGGVDLLDGKSDRITHCHFADGHGAGQRVERSDLDGVARGVDAGLGSCSAVAGCCVTGLATARGECQTDHCQRSRSNQRARGELTRRKSRHLAPFRLYTGLYSRLQTVKGKYCAGMLHDDEFVSDVTAR